MNKQKLKFLKQPIMKKLLILSFIILGLNSQAQFEKFEENSSVKSYIVNKKMFDMMSKMKIEGADEEVKQYMNLLKKLDKLTVYTTSNAKLTNEFKSTAQSYISDNKLEELMKVSESGKNVKVYFRNGASNELFMFVDDKESILLSLKGNFELSEITVLTEKLNLPGKEELKKATKNKK